MSELYETNMTTHRPWKKVLSVILSVILAFGTLVTLTVGSSRLQDWLGIKSMLSAYAAEYVDTAGAIAVDKDAMLADPHTINLENRDGSNTVYLFSEPISFTDENGNLKTKDISVVKETDKALKAKGYTYTNGQNDYRIHFAQQAAQGVLVQFDGGSYTVAPVGNTNSIGEKNTSVSLNEEFETFSYANAYGDSTALQFYPQLNGVKDEITLDKFTGQTDFAFRLTTENCTAVLQKDGTVELQNSDGKCVQTFAAPFAYDSAYVVGDKNDHYTDCSYQLKQTGDHSYTLTVSVSKDWLQNDNTAYPVTIDPVTANIANYRDAGVYSAAACRDVCYGKEATCCLGKSQEYGRGQVYNMFTMPDSIKKGAKINSAYNWQRETTGRTSNFYVTPYLVKGAWEEGKLTWNLRPGYHANMAMTRRNINSKSTDDPNNVYWYKFNIAKAVQMWANGAYKNYGIVFISEEESKDVYNWRAFASKQYGTSAMQPYTVINYTNDTTAPTVTGVSGNPTSWVKDKVTLTVNGAKDETGGSGLHATPYSFSTEKGKYAWQKGNTKTFTANDTIYVYVRDAAGNIRLVSTQNITKIDTQAPTVGTVAGNPTSWTNANVTLKVTGAKDTQSGLHSSAYSFSTVKESYNWQKENYKTFSANQTVYIYVRDAVGHPASVGTVNISKIDKSKPSAPQVTLDAAGWTNQDITVSAQSTDQGSGVAAYSFSYAEQERNWRTDKTFTVDREAPYLYVASKDAAGNQSEVVSVSLSVDKTLPTGSATLKDPDVWSVEKVITAVASDALSGLSDSAYSFSLEKDVYNWQGEASKTVTKNGTYYVDLRDAAGNILSLDPIVVDHIDNTKPEIQSIDRLDNDGTTTITVLAKDDQSGIAAYSFDNGVSWQDSNQYSISTDSLNFLSVIVKDNVGNVSAVKHYDFYAPQVYCENGKVGLYNPNPNTAGSDIYYKFSQYGKWIKYEKPFLVTKNQSSIYTSFYEKSYAETNASQPVVLPIDFNEQFALSCDETDLTLSYNGVTFALERKYSDRLGWQFSTDSRLNLLNSGAAVSVLLPNLQQMQFVKQTKYVYVSETSDYKLSVVYDAEDQNVVEYVVSGAHLDYHFSADGKLHKISNAYGDLFTLDYSANLLTVTDGAGRQMFMRYENERLLSVTDVMGGTLHYAYSGAHLVRVTDQADVVLGEYAYTGDLLTRIGYSTIARDNLGRISKITKDNGFVTEYAYSKNTVQMSASDETTSSITYNDYGEPVSSTDSSGEVTTYKYDSEHNLIETVVGESKTTYSYDEQGRIDYQRKDDEWVSYLYDDAGNPVCVEKSEDKDTYGFISSLTYYVYDAFGNPVLQAELDQKESGDLPEEYDDSLVYKNVVKYEYQSGLNTKTISDDGNAVTVNLYDTYGNLQKTTLTQTADDGTTSLTSTESTFDLAGRQLTCKSGESETAYTYDAAGRTLLVLADGEYQRTVYDAFGRTIQEIDNSDYDPQADVLPRPYPNTDVGQRYVYNSKGDLIKEINKLGLATNYTYAENGTLHKKSFDIYDYYYQSNGKCAKIDVNGNTVVSYGYKVTDSSLCTADKTVDRVSYANGAVVEKRFDKSGNLDYATADNKALHSTFSAVENGYRYTDSAVSHLNTITSTENSFTYKCQTTLFKNLFSYSVTKDDDTQTVTETHFSDKSYKTVIAADATTYTSPAGTYKVLAVGDDSSATQHVETDTDNFLFAKLSGKEDGSLFNKAYTDYDQAYRIQYGTDGNVIADERNQYTYDSHGQLIRVSGADESSYTYDSRGNLLSKTEDGIPVQYAYTNAQWPDQVTAVDGVALTYDQVGNLTGYGARQYNWTRGKLLESVTDEQGSYTYTYDADGYRATKVTANGKTTFDTIGGQLLAQAGPEGNLYFQYSGGTPFGFVLDDIQYYYLTNLNGDVVGITDAQGKLLAQYVYDPWGKLLQINTTEPDNADQLAVATANPLRYRGYYYDSETGMYYLQSRYYDPDLGRFISADDFDCLTTSNFFSVNAYAYCWNSPIAFKDSEGNTPNLALAYANIKAFLVDVNGKIAEKLEAKKQKFLEKLQERVENLKAKFDEAKEKAKYYLKNPDVFASKIASRIAGHEVTVRFPLLELLRAAQKKKAENDQNQNASSQQQLAQYKIKVADDEKTTNWFLALMKAIVLAIPANAIFKGIETAIKNTVNDAFDWNRWYDKLSSKMKNAVQEIGVFLSSTMINIHKELFKSSEEHLLSLSFDEIIAKLIKEKPFSIGTGGLVSVVSAFNNHESGRYTTEQAWIAALVGIATTVLTTLIPISPKIAIGVDLTSYISNLIMDSIFNYNNGHLWGYDDKKS